MEDLIEKAIIFAAKAHGGQTRKGTNIPYITHPYAVGMYLLKAKCSEEVIAAGILHDTLEDTDTTFEELAAAFGVRVANLVAAASENDKSLPWEARKQQTIDHLKQASLEEIQVITADKLHNLRSIRADLHLHGNEIWERFKRGKREQHWYYAGIVKALTARNLRFRLIRELREEVEVVFGSLEMLTEEEIDLLFSCTYLHISEEIREELAARHLISLAESVIREAEKIYRNQHELTTYELVTAKLEDLHSRGIKFETNSEGPFILASFCIALQNKMQWSDQELYKHFKRNAARL